jgi:hypothetical protein
MNLKINDVVMLKDCTIYNPMVYLGKRYISKEKIEYNFKSLNINYFSTHYYYKTDEEFLKNVRFIYTGVNHESNTD